MGRMKKEEIKERVIKALQEYKSVKSLNELKRIAEIKVTNKRLAKILGELYKEGKIKVFLTTSLGIYDKCPICKSDLQKVFITNLFGQKELVAFKCKNCFYRCEVGKMKISRYKIVLNE